FCGGAIALSSALGHPDNRPLHGFSNWRAEPSRGSLEDCLTGDYIRGHTRLEAADCDHRRMFGIDGTGNNGLQRAYQGTAGHDGIDSEMRLRRVRAPAGDLDLEEVGRGQHIPVAPVELSHLHRGHIVHAEDSLHGEAIEQAIGYDLPATADFLGRLK